MSAAAGPEFAAAADGCYQLKGPLVIATVTRLREQMLTALAAGSGECRINLAAVAPVDSAGLALLVDLLAWAKGAGRTVKYLAMTPAITALARISEVESLLAA